MICRHCKYAVWDLTPKRKRLSINGDGRCTAKFQMPDLDRFKVPALVQLELNIKRFEIVQMDLLNPDYDEPLSIRFPEKCDFFERKTNVG